MCYKQGSPNNCLQNKTSLVALAIYKRNNKMKCCMNSPKMAWKKVNGKTKEASRLKETHISLPHFFGT